MNAVYIKLMSGLEIIGTIVEDKTVTPDYICLSHVFEVHFAFMDNYSKVDLIPLVSINTSRNNCVRVSVDQSLIQLNAHELPTYLLERYKEKASKLVS